MIYSIFVSIYTVNRHKLIYWSYYLFDLLFSYLLWFSFWIVRKHYILQEPIESITIRELFLYPLGVSLGWILLYWFWGLYDLPTIRSLLKTTTALFQATILGSLIIFFTMFIDDPIHSYKDLRLIFFLYFGAQFFVLLFYRFLYNWYLKRLVRKGKLTFRSLLIGQGEKALAFVEKELPEAQDQGHCVKGYIRVEPKKPSLLFGKVKRYGDLPDLEQVITRRRIEELILALEPNQNHLLFQILQIGREHQLFVSVIPDLYEYLLGTVRLTQILDSPSLLEVYPNFVTKREAILKRMLDVTVSILALTLGFPFLIIIAILIKLDSQGPIFYTQERIGKNGKPFTIYKFRTMYVDAEKNGPALATDNDPRITRVGRFLRKTRLDEFPQFFNIIKGDMSLVGPRPERQYFIDQIVQRAPEYRYLLRVRPGLTSLGQVKYGYAENIDQMIERMKYDLLYIENYSLSLDLKILFYTVIVVLEGRGK